MKGTGPKTESMDSDEAEKRLLAASARKRSRWTYGVRAVIKLQIGKLSTTAPVVI
jgi:hypothetical protein